MVSTNLKRYAVFTRNKRTHSGGFFINRKHPHKAVTSTTIARWAVNVLKEAVVFEAHSTRSAALSMAREGLNLAGYQAQLPGLMLKYLQCFTRQFGKTLGRPYQEYHKIHYSTTFCKKYTLVQLRAWKSHINTCQGSRK